MTKYLKIFFICLIIIAPFQIYGQQVNYQITRSCASNGNNKYAYLFIPSTPSILRKTEIINAHFTFKGTTSEQAVVADLFVSPMGTLSKDWYYKNISKIQKRPTVLEDQPVQIIMSNNPEEAIVKGGELNNQENQLFGIKQWYSSQWKETFNKYKETMDVLKGSANDEKDIEALRQNQLLLLQKTYFNKELTFAEEHITSPFTLDILNGLSGVSSKVNAFDYDTLKSLYEKLPQKERESNIGKRIKKYLAEQKNLINLSVKMGEKAPPFEIKTLQGKDFELKNYSGKYLLVDFWASWCGPCRREFPYIKEAYKEYHERGFDILTISLDTSVSQWKKACSEEGLPWMNAQSISGFKGKLAKLYHITFIPQNFLINPHGQVVAKNIRGEDVITAIKKAIDNHQ